MKLHFLCLWFLVPLCVWGQVTEKPIVIDTLFIQTDSIYTFQAVRFTPKVPQTRMVNTISCSCDDIDFYYQLYKWEEDAWKRVVDHTEKPSQPRCECKFSNAAFENGNVYTLPPIVSPGTYYLQIEGWGFRMMSSAFRVFNK